MSEWHRENPELAEEIAKLPPSMQNAAERALIPSSLEIADRWRKESRDDGLTATCLVCSKRGHPANMVNVYEGEFYCQECRWEI